MLQSPCESLTLSVTGSLISFALLRSISVSFCQNLIQMVVLINFCLFPSSPSPPWHFDLFTISIKNQVRLTQKIVDSYSWVFTVYCLISWHLPVWPSHLHHIQCVPINASRFQTEITQEMLDQKAQFQCFWNAEMYN